MAPHQVICFSYILVHKIEYNMTAKAGKIWYFDF